MMRHKLLYSGFDQFDVAFQGALSLDALEHLAKAKQQAKQTGEPALVTLGPGRVDMHVADHGMRGGFAYVCDTGPTGEKWFFKKSSSRSDWNIFASVHSQALICEPLAAIFDSLRQTLANMGAAVGMESINRIDFAMDFLAPGFALDHTQFVAHRRTKIRPYWSEKPTDENQPAAVFAGRACESVTIGKMPNRQIIVYDKRRDSIDKGKRYWFKVWGIDPKDASQEVWRVELRAGKQHLKEAWGIRSFADVEASIGDVLKATLEDVRYLAVSQSDSNVTRQTIHPLWEEASRHAFYALSAHHSGLTKGQIKTIERERQAGIYRAQIMGLLAGLATVSGEYPDEEYDELPGNTAKEILSAVSNPKSGFYKAIEKANRRFHFL